ncbi:hypothetical protein Tsumi_11350 [Porphyromonas miyakawae]|uniref:Uncharacterized protein n=1 Tax=Porphyromonas miyakawae TaxID=3137470 RepID=A0ABQ0E2W5_9PORP
MDRIQLSKDERIVLRQISLGWKDSSLALSEDRCRLACINLERLGLIRVAWLEGYQILYASLTEYGVSYLAWNPRLRNPIDYKKLGFILACVSLVASIVVALVACSRLW